MNKLLLIAFAPLAMLANPAGAQTTMQRTVSTPSHTVTTTRTVVHTPRVVTHRTVTHRRTTTISHARGRAMRECHWKWRNHHRVRVCTTVRHRY